MSDQQGENVVPIKRRNSPTRSASNTRASRRRELLRGNANSLRHGIYATVANLPDITTEVALIYAARPSLDPIADRRLVEACATASAQYSRAVVAMERDGFTSALVAAARDFGNRAERLERAVHERANERAKAQAAATARPDLSAYRPSAVEDAS